MNSLPFDLPPPPERPEDTVLWQGTSAWKDITTGKQRRCPARIVETNPWGVFRLEFADMPQHPDVWACWSGVKLREPDPVVPTELLERLDREFYDDEE